jgi:AraC-like DNA-binding protein
MDEIERLKERVVRKGGIVRAGTVLAAPAVLRSLGANPADVLAGAGVDLALFDDPDNPMPFAVRSRLIRHCVEQTGCRHFGLLVGQQGGLHSLGLVGLLMEHAPNVGSALRSLERFFHLHARGGTVSLALSEQTAMLSYDIYQAGVEAADQLGDGAVAVIFNILGELCGADWKPLELRFAHRRPDDVRPFQRFFQAPLKFDAEQNGVVFSAGWLQRPLARSDTVLRLQLQNQMVALERTCGHDLREQVRAVLRTALLTGNARADEIAALFSMHGRTFSRRLADCGASFQSLADEGRFAIACQMLENTDVDIKQIAVILDYADASAFARAFRRWSGVTPSHWRAGAYGKGALKRKKLSSCV